jgi:undecaprenyl-diphosphatase
MKLIAGAMRLDNVFLVNIFQLNDIKLVSTVLPLASHSANGYYYPLIAAFLFLIDPGNAVRFLLAALIAFAIELPVCTIMKYGIKRSRPFEALSFIYKRRSPGDRFSLPSGHTAAAFVMIVLLSSFYPILILPLVIWATLAGMSRIYLGVHYPSDVLAGMAVGILSGLSGITFLSYIFQG